MGQLFKNTASQKVRVFAFADAGHATLDPGEPVTGDAANISAQTAVDNAALGASDDVAPAEVDATNAPGYYEFDPLTAETNGDVVEWYPKSSTAGVQVVTVGGNVQTTQPPNFPALGIESDGDVTKVNTLDGHTAQTADNDTKISLIPTTAMRGTDSALLASTFATMFSGITALAEWLGLLAGKQTGNSTARTEIRATGAGSGTFDETNDSLEALRERGDAAWTTGAGGSAPSVEDIRTEMDSNSTQLAAIVADTNELQTDLTNGGRLDLLIDAIKAKTDNLPSDPADQSLIIAATNAIAAILGSPAGSDMSADIAAVKAVVDLVVADTGTDGVVLSTLTKNAIADALLDRADGVEPVADGTERTVREALRVILAAAAGKSSNGGKTFRDLNDTKDVIAATVDGSFNRTAVTIVDT